MHRSFVCACVALFSGTALIGAPVNISFKLDSYASNGPARPLPWASVDFEVKDPAFSTHAGAGTIAGLLSGTNTTTGQRYYVFCSELNQDISIGAIYSFTRYDDYVDAPIQNGRPMGTGKLLNRHDKRLVAGVLNSLGVDGEIMGFVSSTGQDLIGIAATNPDSSTLRSISNDQAAAAQIAIWTLVHGLGKDKDAISLVSDTFRITRVGGQPVTQEFQQVFQTTVEGTFAAVPEPSLLMAGVALCVPPLALRPKRNRRK